MCCIQYLGCLQREKRLFTCRHAHRSLTTLVHPASTLAALIKTMLWMAESEWYGVTVFPLPAGRKECQKHMYLLMRSSRSETGHSCHIYYFRFTCHVHIVNRISQPVLLGSAVTDPKKVYSGHIKPLFQNTVPIFKQLKSLKVTDILQLQELNCFCKFKKGQLPFIYKTYSV